MTAWKHGMGFGMLVFVLVLTGCGKSRPMDGLAPETREHVGEASEPAEAPAAASAEEAFPRDRATSRITGRVIWNGPRPKVRFIRGMESDPACHATGGDAIVDPAGYVNEDGTVPNVFVYIRRGVQAWKFDAPSQPVKLVQTGCMYVPHVFGLMVGQPVEISSEDNTTHNVHFVPRKQKGFNETQKKGQRVVKYMKRAEVMARFKCDVHSWMTAWVGVLYHPFYSVTEDGGRFVIGMLPPGEYEIAAWHEKYGTRARTIKLADHQTLQMEFSFSK